MHKVLLGLVPVTVGFAFLLRMTRPLEEIHRILRWLGLPLAAFMLAGTYQAFLISRSVYLTGLGICSTANAAAWHQFWGVAQMLAVIVSAPGSRMLKDSMWPLIRTIRINTIRPPRAIGANGQPVQIGELRCQ